eukprot:4234900-Alexandrium_andersonii.AAC.1
MGERAVRGPSDSVPARMFRIAGLFEEFGCASLAAKLCLNWVDVWRVGATPHNNALIDIARIEQGSHFPFAVVSDSTLAFRPSSKSYREGVKIKSKTLTD